jgi:Flp pilus assembly protein TadD
MSQGCTLSIARPREKARFSFWRLSCFAILILSAVIYGAALHGLPIWEDDRLIASGGTGGLVQCFTTPFLGAYFRPLVSVSFFLDHYFWIGEPFMYHQTNILLHVLTTAALIGALRAAFGSRRIALVGGLLFAVQPAQVSTVAWIGGRTDSLCALWIALFAWAVIRAAQTAGRKRGLLLGLGVVAYALALLTKEQAVLLLPLVPLAFRCFRPASQEKSQEIAWRESLPFALASLGFLALWFAIGPKLPPTASHTLGYKLGLCGRTLTYYALLLVAPTPQWMHTVTVISLERAGIWSILTGYALLALALALVVRWLRFAPAAAWFLALVVLSLLPVSNLLPLGSLIVAPFRAGVAGLGIAALCGWAIAGVASSVLRQPRPMASPAWRWAVGGLFAAWCLGLTVWGAGQWYDQPKIFATMVRYDPGSTYVREGIIGSLMEAHQPAQARAQAESMLDWYFGSHAWQQPASAVRAFEQDPQVEARIHSSNGDKRVPRRALADLFTHLAYSRLACDDTSGALAAFQTGAALDPNNPSVNLGLGRQYYAARDWPQAIHYLHLSVQVNPRVPASHILLGSSYEQQRQWKAACAEYDATIDLQPWDGTGYLALAGAQGKEGDYVAACATLEAGLHHAESDREEMQQKLTRFQSHIGR